MINRGMSLVETMIVLTLAVLILLPTISFMTMTRKVAYKGMDRLETLTFARRILESAQRDLKAYCWNKTQSFAVDKKANETKYVLPVFPIGQSGLIYQGDDNPVNIVTYSFKPKQKTLTRTLQINGDLLGGSTKTITKVLAKNVASFSISPDMMLGVPYYSISVLCVPSHPDRKSAETHLKGGVCSNFQVRLERNSTNIPNMSFKIDLPK